GKSSRPSLNLIVALCKPSCLEHSEILAYSIPLTIISFLCGMFFFIQLTASIGLATPLFGEIHPSSFFFFLRSCRFFLQPFLLVFPLKLFLDPVLSEAFADIFSRVSIECFLPKK